MKQHDRLTINNRSDASRSSPNSWTSSQPILLLSLTLQVLHRTLVIISTGKTEFLNMSSTLQILKMRSRRTEYRKQPCARWWSCHRPIRHSRSLKLWLRCNLWPHSTLINKRGIGWVASKGRHSKWHLSQMKTQKNIYSHRVVSTRKIRAQIHSALTQASRVEIRAASSIRVSQLDWTTPLGLDRTKIIRWSIRAGLMKRRTLLNTSYHPSCYSHQVSFKLLSNSKVTCKTIRWCSLHNRSPSPPSSRPSLTMNRDKATQGDVENTATASPEEQGLVESICKHLKMLSWAPVNGTCHSWEI